MELGEVTEFSGESEETGTEASPYLEINEYAPLHPATRSWEVERENVTIEKVIGKGAFGQVAQGTASELRGRDGTTRVAIKMLKGNFSVRQNVFLFMACVFMEDPVKEGAYLGAGHQTTTSTSIYLSPNYVR